ncbi:MAG: LLM class F420-dependent oxidoreductase [Deltaproteobacteria bacterium]|nr:LLM class F420-dependent oxidoreductase [Deltaproteobacteria bacterium]
MKFIISAAFQPAEHLLPIAMAAEAAGFEAIASSDHAVYPRTLDTPYPYTPDGTRRYDEESEFPDPWVLAGAMSSVTKRLRFTSNVYVLPMRNPFLAAKQVATAAALSKNRVTLTVGVGWSKLEFELLEQAFERRGARADEMIEVMQKLLSGGWVTHEGEFYQFNELKLTPPIPTEPIPIWVGGISDFALRRAARQDGWLSDLQTSAEIIDCVSRVRRYRSEFGKSSEFEAVASASDAADVDGYRRLEDGGITHVLTLPWVFYYGLTNSLEEKVDGIKRFAEETLSKFP